MHYALAFAFILITFFALSFDDDLSEDSQTFITSYESRSKSTKNEAYWYLMGLDAPEGINPIDHGNAKINETDNHHLDADLPNLDLCKTYHTSCFETLLNHRDVIEDYLSRYAYMMENYHHFLSLSNYRTLGAHDMKRPLPSYQALMFSHQLYLIGQLINSNSDIAIENLLANLKKLEDVLKQQDTLIGVNILAALYAEHIDMIRYVAYKNKQRVTFNPISQIETTLKRVLITEFMIGVD